MNQRITSNNFSSAANAYRAFASNPENQGKVVVNAKGDQVVGGTSTIYEKICNNLSNIMPSSVAAHYNTIEFVDDKHRAVVDHFKSVLQQKYGEKMAGCIFSQSDEVDALKNSLSDVSIKQVFKKADAVIYGATLGEFKEKLQKKYSSEVIAKTFSPALESFIEKHGLSEPIALGVDAIAATYYYTAKSTDITQQVAITKPLLERQGLAVKANDFSLQAKTAAKQLTFYLKRVAPWNTALDPKEWNFLNDHVVEGAYQAAIEISEILKEDRSQPVTQRLGLMTDPFKGVPLSEEESEAIIRGQEEKENSLNKKESSMSQAGPVLPVHYDWESEPIPAFVQRGKEAFKQSMEAIKKQKQQQQLEQQQLLKMKKGISVPVNVRPK